MSPAGRLPIREILVDFRDRVPYRPSGTACLVLDWSSEAGRSDRQVPHIPPTILQGVYVNLPQSRAAVTAPSPVGFLPQQPQHHFLYLLMPEQKHTIKFAFGPLPLILCLWRLTLCSPGSQIKNEVSAIWILIDIDMIL